MSRGSGTLAALSSTASVWGVVFACIAIVIVVAILAFVALAITRAVVGKARPEDLPEVLSGLSTTFSSMACFLPWGRRRQGFLDRSALARAGGTSLEAPDVRDTEATAPVLPLRPLAPTAGSTDTEEGRR